MHACCKKSENLSGEAANKDISVFLNPRDLSIG